MQNRDIFIQRQVISHLTCPEESVEVGPAAEPACAKAAGSLRSPGQCDGAGGGSRRAPGLDLRAGLGSGAVLSVRGGPTVEWQP